MALLEISELIQKFGGLRAIDRLDLSVETGQIFGLIGPNGSGKSTVFNCVSRFYNPQAGRIHFNDQNLLKQKPHQVIRLGIARTFQNLELFSNMTVLDNILVARHSRFRANIFSCAFNLPHVGRREKIARRAGQETLEILGLAQFQNTLVSALPLGIRRRVEMARALASEPRLLLLDEPAAGLNQVEIKELTKSLENINKQLEVTILLVEHNMNIVMNLCRNIAVMNFGRKIAEGRPEEVRNDTEVIKAYLGEKR